MSTAVLLPTVSRPRSTSAQRINYFVHFLAEYPRVLAKIDLSTMILGCNFALDTALYSFFSKDGEVIHARYTFTYKWDGSRWLISSHHSSKVPVEDQFLHAFYFEWLFFMRKIYRYFIIRYKNRVLKNKLNCFLGYLLLWIPLIAFAGIEQHGKIWLGLDKSGLLLSDSDWLYTLSTQMRGITSSAVLQTFFFDGRLGYPFFTDFSVWVGYRWSGNHPGKGFYSEQRTYQQIQFSLTRHSSIQFMARSRLEERIRSNQDQVALGFR